MKTSRLFDDTSSFRIRRSQMTTNGIISDVDKNVRRYLDELNSLIGKPLLNGSGHYNPSDSASFIHGGDNTDKIEFVEVLEPDANDVSEAETKDKRQKKARGKTDTDRGLGYILGLPLTAKHIPKLSNGSDWDDVSLAAYLKKANGRAVYTLADHIDMTPTLAKLKYAFLEAIEKNWTLQHFDSRAVMEQYPNIVDYLIASAYYKVRIRDVDALKKVIVKKGARLIADYAAVSAARWLIDHEQLKVEDYNDNDSEFVKQMVKGEVPLSAISFETNVRRIIRELVFDSDEEKVIRASKIWQSGGVPENLLPQLIRYIQQWPTEIKESVDAYLPGIVLQLIKQPSISTAEMNGDLSTEEFRVQFIDDSDSTVEINKSAVLCAAQLYHGMVMGEELDIFGAVHYLAHRRMNTFGGMRIQDKALRDDLQRYVFDNRYIDLKAGSSNERAERFRTRPAERQMFYRQVFDEGNAEMPEDMLVNGDFKRLWKVLMLESARYLDRAQASMNPESFVSPQNVMQAVEDLQYNLSTNCTGMVTVISPAVDAELNFVLRRILKHEEILRQVVPEGGTWKRAVDKLNGERRRPTGLATTLYNKATQGKGIIEMIAEYTPAAFEDDGTFSAFISKVDAYITTQSILMKFVLKPKYEKKEVEDQHVEEHQEESLEEEAKPAMVGGTPTDEWDF